MPIGTKPQTLRNRRKCIAYIIAGIILQTLIIVAFVLIFMRLRAPKVRLRSITIENLTSSSTSSLSLRLNAQVTVKNPNFGRFKFPDSEMAITYQGKTVGTAVIPGGRSGTRSTKKVNVTAAVAVAAVGDLNSGRVTLSGHATLDGRVYLIGVIKKKKTATMDCTMDVNTKTRAVEKLKCK